MSDYIKREDALKAVDDIVCDADDAERTCDRIIDLPSEDVVPVVRCKDCAWYVRSMIKQDGTLDERYKPDWCDLYRRVREETYFCAEGERRIDE